MSNLAVLKVLKDARDLIRTPDRWCKGSLANDEKGAYVYPNMEKAYSFCAIGAILKASRSQSSDTLRDAIKLLEDFLPSESRVGIVNFNNNYKTTHSDILELFDKAIISLECPSHE